MGIFGYHDRRKGCLNLYQEYLFAGSCVVSYLEPIWLSGKNGLVLKRDLASLS